VEVVFSKLADFNTADVVVIVACEEERNFVESKLKLLFSECIPQGILNTCSDLSYKNINSFCVIVGSKLVEIVIVGAGREDLASRASVEKLGGYIFDSIKTKNANVCVLNNIESSEMRAASYLASGILLKSWTFDKYKTKKVQEKVRRIECQTNYIDLNKSAFTHIKTVDESVFLVRNLVTEPANVLDPDQLLDEAEQLKKLGVKVTILDEGRMRKLGMNALLGVASGSDKPAYTVVMEYQTDKLMDSIALIGKGLTFDSGGICLKPSNKMGDMKGDMTGAAVVIGIMRAIALQKAKTNIVGVIGVVENMISGKAQRPGDVVTSMSGKTIEVDNTDAEGRLVLADVLWYTQEKYSPKIMIDFATLTGAIQVALGHEFAGLFSNSDELCDELVKSAKNVGEKLWRMPLHPSYDEDIKSDIADIKNVGSGRGAGSITAALFLKQFINQDVRWAHIDIAATEWDSKNRALSQKGATGFGVRLIDDFLTETHVGGEGD
jgi:leucyl aminopeptidase